MNRPVTVSPRVTCEHTTSDRDVCTNPAEFTVYQSDASKTITYALSACASHLAAIVTRVSQAEI